MTTHTFPTMGTMASLIFGGEMLESDEFASVVAAVEEIFDEDDRRFSLYSADSELSRLNRGELSLEASSAELRAAYALAAEWRLLTYGAFTPERPDGLLDLSGIVKALSIDRARLALECAGYTETIVDVGGDAVTTGLRRGQPWTAGIVDPADRSRLLCAVPLDPRRPAIATSGTAERGEHIWVVAPTPYVQVTVLAADIVTADVLATAILAGGREFRDDATERWAIDVLTVDRLGQVEVTPGMRAQPLVTTASA